MIYFIRLIQSHYREWSLKSIYISQNIYISWRWENPLYSDVNGINVTRKQMLDNKK